jgi:hypothetical protein
MRPGLRPVGRTSRDARDRNERHEDRDSDETAHVDRPSVLEMTGRPRGHAEYVRLCLNRQRPE